MTVLVSIEIETETGVMRRYDSRMEPGKRLRHICDDLDWDAIRQAGVERQVVLDFRTVPPWRLHVSQRPA